MKTDIEIAQSTQMQHIADIARTAGVDEEYLEFYGKYKAKIDYRLLQESKAPNGKLILVTAINPTPAGEGKTTATVGLAGAAFLACMGGAQLLVNVFISKELTGLRVYSASVFRIFSVSFLIVGFNVVGSGYFTAVERPKESLVISLGRGVVILFAALAGCVYCQQKGFFEISAGTGTMVIGLANVIIGTQLFKRFGFVKSTTAVIIGSILYKACVSAALLVGDLKIAGLNLSVPVTASDLKLITSVLFLIILVLSPAGGKKVKSHA